MEHLNGLIAGYGYAGLFVVVVIGNLGFPAALELVLPTCGALAAQGHLPGAGPVPGWIVAALVALAAELVGMSILYAIGAYGGQPFLESYGRYLRVGPDDLERVHAYYRRWGRSTVFWCRFIPFVRGFAALPAGLSQMPKRWFLTYSALGSALFCFGLAFLGDAAGRNLDTLLALLHKAAIGVLAAVVVLVVAGIFVARARTVRQAQGDHTGAP